jgi:hypothetical protein
LKTAVFSKPRFDQVNMTPWPGKKYLKSCESLMSARTVGQQVEKKVTAKDLQNFDVYLDELQKESERLKNKMTTKGSGVLRRTASTLIQSLTRGDPPLV